MEAIANKIKALRHELGMPQREFAKKIGIHPAQLARYEVSRSTPSIDILINIAKFCEVSVDYLVFGLDKEVLKRSRINDLELLELLRRIDNLKKPERDKLKWAIQGLLTSKNNTEVPCGKK